MILCLYNPPQLGQHHTIDMELNRKFTLVKDTWDSVALDRIGVSWFRALSSE
jgi:stalled ribosome rescue protein Dom34